MLRGYRGIIVAAGLALIGAGEPPKQNAQAEKAQRASAVPQGNPPAAVAPTKPAKVIQPPKEKQPCGPHRYRSNDDLCAQWKAADSASQAAEWARWQLWLSGLGVLGLGVTLWFNFHALRIAEKSAAETVDALAIARQNAQAASDANKIAHKAAGEARRNAEAQNKHARASERRQLRAYLGVKSVEFSGYAELGEPIVRVAVENYGQTPASYVQYAAKIAIDPDEIDAPLDWSYSPIQVLAPSQDWGLPVVLRLAYDPSDDQKLVLRCEIKFTDVFGAVWVLHQRFFMGRGNKWHSDKDGNYEELLSPPIVK